MAIKIGPWLGITGGICALVLVLGKPQPSNRFNATDIDGDRAQNVFRESQTRVEREIRRLRSDLNLRRTADSLLVWTRARPGVAEPLVFGDEGTEGVASRVQTTLLDEWNSMAVTGESRVAFYFQSVPVSDDPLQPSSTLGVTTFVPNEGNDFSCFRVVTIPDTHILFRAPEYLTAREPSRFGFDLGRCRAYLRFGVPGEEVGAWLKAHGYRYAAGSTEDTWPMSELRARIANSDNRFMYSQRALDCAARDLDQCRAILNGPLGGGLVSRERPQTRGEMVIWQTNTSSRFFRLPRFGWDFAGAEMWLVDDLISDFGMPAFLRFWKSPEAFDVAFQEMSGQDVAEWLSGWARNTMGLVRRGPGPTSRGAVFMLGMTILAAGAGILATSKRS